MKNLDIYLNLLKSKCLNPLLNASDNVYYPQKK